MRKMQAGFKEAENDEYITREVRNRMIARENERRARTGEPPMLDEEDIDPPEAELYRRARALGLRRVRG